MNVSEFIVLLMLKTEFINYSTRRASKSAGGGQARPYGFSIDDLCKKGV